MQLHTGLDWGGKWNRPASACLQLHTAQLQEKKLHVGRYMPASLPPAACLLGLLGPVSRIARQPANPPTRPTPTNLRTLELSCRFLPLKVPSWNLPQGHPAHHLPYLLTIHLSPFISTPHHFVTISSTEKYHVIIIVIMTHS